MNANQKADFYSLVSDALGFWKQDVSEFGLSVWWEGCKGFDFEQVSKALSAHATDPDRGQFAPKVADIVRQLGGTSTDRALVAWSKVHGAMSNVGAYQDVVFDDAAIHAVIQDMGGWPKLCRAELKEIGFLQHKFCETYRSYVNREFFDYPPRLVGDNGSSELWTKRGLKPPPPTVIGNVEQARLVYKKSMQHGASNLTHIITKALTQ
jgi:hypothetical protein